MSLDLQEVLLARAARLAAAAEGLAGMPMGLGVRTEAGGCVVGTASPAALLREMGSVAAAPRPFLAPAAVAGAEAMAAVIGAEAGAQVLALLGRR